MKRYLALMTVVFVGLLMVAVFPPTMVQANVPD